MKPGMPLFVVDSVETAAKFYSEKLGFDIIELTASKGDGGKELEYVLLKKNKCLIGFRRPLTTELADMSMVKHCAGRGSGIYIEMKKGFDKYFERCNKKKVPIIEQPKKQPWGHVTFSVKDPFGFKVIFAQELPEGEWRPSNDFCGMGPVEKPHNAEQEAILVEKMSGWLKGFGLLRRVSKKYSKLWLKNMFGRK
jgi:uncharacterized glyoxalase superfamily protein PhnB